MGAAIMVEAIRAEPLVLASASPARRSMLTAAGVSCQIDPADIDEASIRRAMTGQPPEAVAARLARDKALATSARRGAALVLAGDQVLVDAAGQLHDKPVDRAAARSQLLALRGQTHRLVSAAALARAGVLLWEVQASARLAMRDFSPVFLDGYLDALGDAVLGSVGGYHIEGLGAQLFAQVDGDPFVIQGLPLLAVLEALRRQGVLIP